MVVERQASAAGSAVEVAHLQNMKRQQEQVLQAISNRIRHLQHVERKIWKEITDARSSCLKRQEAQLRHQGKTVDSLNRARQDRRNVAEMQRAFTEERTLHRQRRDQALNSVYQHKVQAGRNIRCESAQLLGLLNENEAQRQLEAASKAEELRLLRSQAKLKRQLSEADARRERSQRHANRQQELEEQLSQVRNCIERAEQDELGCLRQLQNSRAVRDSLMSGEIRPSRDSEPSTNGEALLATTLRASGQSTPRRLVAGSGTPRTPVMRGATTRPASLDRMTAGSQLTEVSTPGRARSTSNPPTKRDTSNPPANRGTPRSPSQGYRSTKSPPPKAKSSARAADAQATPRSPRPGTR